jgi:polar amino acid transport system substrate-binding protein
MSRVGTRGRRVLVPLLVLIAAAACGGPGATTASRASGTFRPAHPDVLTVATSQVPAPGFWEGTARAPTGGFELGLAKALAKRFELGHVEVVEVAFQDLVAGRLGGADIALSQLTPTAAREKVLDFSEPYLPAKPAVLVRAGTQVADMAAARAQRWSVRRLSTLERFLAKTVRPSHPVEAFDTREESLDALAAGKVDAVLLDLPVAAAIAARSGGRLKVAGQFPTEDNLAVALPNDSSNKDAVDSAVRTLATDGTLRQLSDRWLRVAVTAGAADDIPLIAIPS